MGISLIDSRNQVDDKNYFIFNWSDWYFKATLKQPPASLQGEEKEIKQINK